MAAGLASTNIDMVHSRQEIDKLSAMNGDEAYPYKPDLLIGWHGKKAGLFVVNDRQVMRDSGQVDGLTAKRLSLLEDAQKGKNMFAVGIPIRAMAHYDLASYQLTMKKDFDLMKVIDEAYGK